ncbi:hypothetical protein BDV96DRAFT_11463 [Lophiotrema nucula]|uniref:Uncharacterized protein n=1 Tax=Lophiotrema nucula TaxID=690887 RepID=A0A6A5ZV43_9PLEO|nr:hypothetical protein BDV96DRAFT_11463 [Lophiotrema nucula]
MFVYDSWTSHAWTYATPAMLCLELSGKNVASQSEDVFWDAVTAQHLHEQAYGDYERKLRPKVVTLFKRFNIAGLETGAQRARSLCNLRLMYPGDSMQNSALHDVLRLCERISADNGEHWYFPVLYTRRSEPEGCVCYGRERLRPRLDYFERRLAARRYYNAR